MIRRLILLLCAAVAMTCSAAPADTTVSLVNFYPGGVFYELEGHTVLRLRTPQNDVAISWGQFDFNTEDFVYRFVKGETDYCVAAIPWQPMVELYRRDGRRAVEHVLDFNSAQKAALFDLVRENLMPWNVTYRYNYVKDNCATRPLRLVELAAGDSLALGPSMFEAQSLQPVTYRYVMRHYHRNYPWYQLGIDLALGSGIDAPIDGREATFAPVVLDDMIDRATYGGRRLVRDTRVVIDTAHDAAVAPPTPWYLTPAFVFGLVLAGVIALSVRDIRRRRGTRWPDAVLFGIFGIAGCLLTFLIFVSEHEATSPNWLYLWLNPLCLLVPALTWIPRAQRVLRAYWWINLALTGGMTVAWYWLPQSTNPALWLLVTADLIRAATNIVAGKPAVTSDR